MDHCTKQEPTDRPNMQEVLDVLQRLEALPPATAMQGESQPAVPPFSAGPSSQSTMISRSSKQAPAWKITLKDLRFCRDKQGKRYTVGMGGFGQVTYRPRHHSIGVCPPERQLVEVLSCSWCNMRGSCADGPFLSTIVLVLPSCGALPLNGRAIRGQPHWQCWVCLGRLQPVVHLIIASPQAHLQAIASSAGSSSTGWLLLWSIQFMTPSCLKYLV